MCQVKWSDNETHVTYECPKTSSQITYVPPGFYPPVCRLRTPARFCSEVVIYQIWLQTVKTGPRYGGKCLSSHLRMRTAESLVLAPLKCRCSCPILALLPRQYYQKRDVLAANCTYIWFLATFTMGESPLTMTCIIPCSLGFHSGAFQLHK